MLLPTRARIISCILIIIAVVFTEITLFTCHWVNHSTMKIHWYHGLFEQKGCAIYPTHTPAFVTATLAMMSIALAVKIIFVIFMGISSFLPRVPNSHLMIADVVLIVIAFLMLVASLVTFGVSSGPYWNDTISAAVSKFTFGYSFWLVIPAAVFTLAALVPVIHSLHSMRRGSGDGAWHF